jgi:dGTPase
MGHLNRRVNGYMDINFNTKIKATRPYALMFDLDDKSISMSVYVKRLFKKLFSKHKAAYKASMQERQLNTIIADADCREFYFLTCLIIDYLSGMTDQFAFDEYRAFHVIDEF